MKKIPISTYMFQSLEQIFQRLKRFKETNSRSQIYPKNRPLKVTRKAKKSETHTMQGREKERSLVTLPGEHF